ncbi:hypothetical protein RRG08_011510 [Elysia crispata]|uniref:Uncharacterized protein n=1 Tax=Elysia crispata TaxID=231223 RepID=A0AAE1E4D6_9GAST|nr:hypothetical protein RRG08_011510 [Elysia crispata]
MVQSFIVNVDQHGAVMYCQYWPGWCSHVLSMLARMVQSCSVMLARMVHSCIVNVGTMVQSCSVMLARMVQSCSVMLAGMVQSCSVIPSPNRQSYPKSFRLAPISGEKPSDLRCFWGGVRLAIWKSHPPGSEDSNILGELFTVDLGLVLTDPSHRQFTPATGAVGLSLVDVLTTDMNQIPGFRFYCMGCSERLFSKQDCSRSAVLNLGSIKPLGTKPGSTVNSAPRMGSLTPPQKHPQSDGFSADIGGLDPERGTHDGPRQGRPSWRPITAISVQGKRTLFMLRPQSEKGDKSRRLLLIDSMVAGLCKCELV